MRRPATPRPRARTASPRTPAAPPRARTASPRRPRGWAPQLGGGLGLVAFAWSTSLAGVEPVRYVWFQLVWAGWILAADAIVLARTGASLLRTGGRRLAGLVALSSVLWWGYEIANWRLRNWYYVGGGRLGPVGTVLFDTVAFATVLPALAESRDLLRSFLRLPDPPPLAISRRTVKGLLAAGLVILPLVFAFPAQLFPLVWVAPLLVLDAWADLRGRPSALGRVRAGRAGPVLLVALAGLATGVLWETWNWHALPHWSYRVPHFGFAKVFEMPLLGYLGYLPFALAADAVWRTVSGGPGGLGDDPVTRLGPDPRLPAGPVG